MTSKKLLLPLGCRYSVLRPFAKPGANLVTMVLNVSLFLFFNVALMLKVKLLNDVEPLGAMVLAIFVVSFVVPFIPYVTTVRTPRTTTL